jgi:hypothetical protein
MTFFPFPSIRLSVFFFFFFSSFFPERGQSPQKTREEKVLIRKLWRKLEMEKGKEEAWCRSVKLKLAVGSNVRSGTWGGGSIDSFGVDCSETRNHRYDLM